MSTTEEGLQKSLNALNDYCKKWKLNVIHKKTKCMIFSKASKTKNLDLTINSRIIENTKEFKYLRISINSKDCTFKPTRSDLSSKTNKAIYSLLSKKPIILTPVKTMLKLLDCCIAPILLYGSRPEGGQPILSMGAKHLLPVRSSEHVQQQNFEGCMRSRACVRM